MNFPAKTEAGREALRLRDPTLSARDRQIMVLANGARAFQELAGMVGVGGAAAMERLAELGFLSLAPTVAPARLAAVPDASPLAAKARRCSAAAKMYILDVLQMIRGPEAQVLATLVHSCGSEEELLDKLAPVLERMAALTRPRYALRVCQHLQTLLPLSALPRLQDYEQSLREEAPAT